jgi:hypothetical protein
MGGDGPRTPAERIAALVAVLREYEQDFHCTKQYVTIGRTASPKRTSRRLRSSSANFGVDA